MKVLHVITTLNRGGAETMLAGLCRLPGEKVKPTVAVLLSKGLLAEELRAGGVEVLELGFGRRLPNPFGLLKLAAWIRRNRPDVVQGWMYHADLTALLALWLSGRRNRTVLAWGIRCSDMDLARYSAVLRGVVRLCARLSRLPDVVIANSEAGRRVHAALGYRPRQFAVIHNGIDADRFAPDLAARATIRAELGIPADSVVFIHVARVDPMKDHAGFLAAMALLPDAVGIMVGRDTETLPPQANVIALGQRSDVPRLLNCADAVVSSSAYGEGFSNAIAEGMASGLTPIATDVGDAGAMILGTGWIVAPRNIAALASAMAEFMALRPERRAERGQAARQRIISQFNLAGSRLAFQAVYDKCEADRHAH